MLSKPQHGWTDFQLEGTSVYGLSYLNDIAFEWLDQAIQGLKTLHPFCVKGCLEPNRFLCMVSYWNCYIIVENDGQNLRKQEETTVVCSNTSMLAFCRSLHHDISENLEQWACFTDHSYEPQQPSPQKIALLQEKLNTLKYLILSKENDFGVDGCFL